MQQLQDDIDKMKLFVGKETRAVEQQTQQRERLNAEIRNVVNLISVEDAKLSKGKLDEYDLR
jgi:hypothetical protein